MKRDKKFKTRLSIFLILAGLAAFCVSIPVLRSVMRARAILRAEKNRVRQEKRLNIRETSFSPAANAGIRLRLGPAEIRDAVEFQGAVYAATSAGLQQYSPQGKLLQQWTISEGFPTLDVTALGVAGDTLWVGTADAGWLRYHDGNWKQSIPEDKGLRSVRALLPTLQGAVYIGTANGVLRFDGKEYAPFYPDRLNRVNVTRLAGDSLRLWIGTFDAGLFAYEKGELKHVGAEEGLADSLITDIAIDGNGVFISTPSGILRLENGQFQRVLNHTFVQSLKKRGSELWAASRDRGLIRVPVSTSLRRPANFLPAVPQTNRGGVLLREIGRTLLAFAPGEAWYLGPNSRWQNWSEPVSTLADSNISSMLRTTDGKLWIGYFDHGVEVFNADFESVARYQDDVFFCVNYLSQDAAGRIYVSTANGLAIIEPGGSRRIYREADGLLSDRVMQAVPLDADGKRVAIATAQGFSLLEDHNIKSLYAFHGLVNNHVYSIAARGDQIYVGTLGGISRISNMRVVSSWTQMDSGLRRNWVNALLALDNRLLVGTYGSGIQARSETGDWTGFDSLPENFEVNPNAFFYDGRFVFCGTLDRGVYVYDTQRNRWKQILRELPGPDATAFARDGNALYVATDRGLLQISYDKLNTLPDLH